MYRYNSCNSSIELLHLTCEVSIDTLEIFWCPGAELFKNKAVALKMPDDARPSPDASLEGVLQTAQRALARGDGWDIEPRHYDRLRANCEAVGLPGNDLSITIALRHAFSEITSTDLRRRPDPSYSGLADGQTLYDCRWRSQSRSREMYIKFAVRDEGVEIFSFHEHVVA